MFAYKFDISFKQYSSFWLKGYCFPWILETFYEMLIYDYSKIALILHILILNGSNVCLNRNTSCNESLDASLIRAILHFHLSLLLILFSLFIHLLQTISSLIFYSMSFFMFVLLIYIFLEKSECIICVCSITFLGECFS